MVGPRGLSEETVQKKLREFGKNEIHSSIKLSALTIFFRQFTSVLVFMLIVASLLSFFVGEKLDALLIFLIIIMNALFGFIQEYKAEKAIESIKHIAISTVHVIRDGRQQEINSVFLVPGDLIYLEVGDKIPADCVVLESMHLKVNEASLTGESIPIEKNPHDEENKYIYLGTTVYAGRATCQVLKTGMDTKFGKLALSLTHVEKLDTPLQKKVKNIGIFLGIFALCASTLMFVVGILSGKNFYEMLLISMSLAVAAVPESLPAVMTITLAVGVQKMVQKHAVVRKLSAIEAMGVTSLIATDKTGTLTENVMTITHVWRHGHDHDVASKTSVSEGFKQLLYTGLLCNNATLIESHGSASHDFIGDGTEVSLLKLGKIYGFEKNDVVAQKTLVEEYSFDSSLTRMSVVWKVGKEFFVYTKGSPESILAISHSMMTAKGDIVVLSEKDKKHIEEQVSMYASKSLRVLALAQKVTKTPLNSREQTEKNLVFLGFVGIEDPVREGVKDAILQAKNMGIRTVMVTGDYPLTAHAVATKIHLIEAGQDIITGEQLDEMNDEQLMLKLPNIAVFARTTPEHKLRIVKLFQKLGHTVTVTGDGVNDSLAIKQADVGVSMGITGTDVAKETADIILLDDNYVTLVSAIEQGRTIFDNMKATIQFLLAANLGEICAMIGATMLGLPIMFTPFQLLFINLVTDSLPAFALALTPSRKRRHVLQSHHARKFFLRKDYMWFAEISIITTIITIFMFWMGNTFEGIVLGRTLAFSTLIMTQLFVLLDVWSRDESMFQKKIYHHPIIWIALLVPVCLLTIILFIQPINILFKMTYVSIPVFFSVILVSSIPAMVSELRKDLSKRMSKG